jgi:myo-inositol-1(or 4)-monophosphatase
MLQTAVEAARRAGEVIVARYPAGHTLTVKGRRDIATEVDTAAEAVILDLVRARFPDHAILSEEAGGDGIGDGYTWVVDPLDGTTNYARGHPTFSVSLAVLREESPLVGVVHDPLRGHTFAARRGGGATLNGRPIHTRRTERLRDALIGLDWAHDDAERREALRRLAALAPRCRTVRSMGSAALACAYVGAGWLDVYFAAGLRPWDTAAASLVVAESGGRISGLEGEPWRVGQPTLLATNTQLHDAVLAAWGDGNRKG